MVNSWSKSTIGQLCDKGGALIQTGPFGSQLHAHDYELIGIPVIPTEAIGRRRLHTEGLPKVSTATAERLSRHKLKEGDILFARRGAQAIGLSAIVEKEHEGWLCGTGAILLRLNSTDVDAKFLSFAFSSEVSMAWLKTHAVGAVMPNLNEGVIRSFPLVLPPIGEQHSIAHILGTLDDKIELNRRMNETLEAMARALFKSWFVDFDPVRAKAEKRQPAGMDAETTALFPASFEESPLGMIPKGWRVDTIADIGENARHGIRPSDTLPATPYIGLEHMPRKSIALSEWGAAGNVTSNKFAFREGDILFGKLRPYFHKVGVAPLDGVCSTDIVVVTPMQPEWFGLLLCHLSSTDFVDAVDAASTGTKMPRTSWRDMARYKVVLPNRHISERFTKQVRPLVETIRCNIMQFRTLAALRDALLPKLLSGEIRVCEAEREVEQVA